MLFHSDPNMAKVLLLSSNFTDSVALQNEITQIYNQTGDWIQIAAVVNNFLNQKVAQSETGVSEVAQAIFDNGLGLKLSITQIEQIVIDFIRQGVDSWSEFFELVITDPDGELGEILVERVKVLDAPNLIKSVPADNTGGVAIGSNIVLKFDEAVKAGEGDIIISSDNEDEPPIAVTDTSQVTFIDNTVTIDLTNDLNPDSIYQVQFASGVITDLAGNPYEGFDLNFDTFTFILTLGEDSFTGTSGDDVFTALGTRDNGGNLVNTLESIDRLDGGTGTDTLTATLIDAAAPALTSIENIIARFGTIVALDLANSTGVQAITVESSTAAGTVSNIGDVATLAVRNQVQNTTFSGNTATSQNLNLDTVGNFTTPTQITVALDSGATTLNLTTNNANAVIGTLASVETLNVAARGVNEIAQGSAGATTEATITGTGSIELQDAFTVLTTLDASGNSGGVTATVDGDAVTVTGGSGADDITYDTDALAATAVVALGAGDDTFTIAAASVAGATVDGGDDNDTLAVTDGAFLDADAADVYSGFETLEIGGGTGIYDMENLPGLIAVTIGAALVGASDITNAAEETTVTVNAEASTDLDLGQDLTYALADAAGDADAVSLTLNAADGDDDATAEGQITVTSFEADDIETFNIASNVADIDPDLANTDYTNIISALLGDSVETLNVSGNANLEITALTAALLKTIDANTMTGGLTVDASAADGVEFIGGSADDDYTGTLGGDTIVGNGGADTIELGATVGATDTLILNAATDSVLNADVDGHDVITNFGTASGGGSLDIIDVGAVGFTGQQSSALANKGALAASAVDGSTLSATTNFFAQGGDRGVAIGTNGGNTYVFIDANKDGDFTATDDVVIQLTGVTDVTLTNFAF